MKKRKKKYDGVKAAARARREEEIRRYGKLVSYRVSSVHKSKKEYNRKDNKIIDLDE